MYNKLGRSECQLTRPTDMSVGDNFKSNLGKESHALFCILALFKIIVGLLSLKNAWLSAIFFLDSNSPCYLLRLLSPHIVDKPHKNTSVLHNNKVNITFGKENNSTVALLTLHKGYYELIYNLIEDNLKPAAHSRKQLRHRDIADPSQGNQLNCFLKCAVESS